MISLPNPVRFAHPANQRFPGPDRAFLDAVMDNQTVRTTDARAYSNHMAPGQASIQDGAIARASTKCVVLSDIVLRVFSDMVAV